MNPATALFAILFALVFVGLSWLVDDYGGEG